MDGHEVRRKTFETLELLPSILVHLPVKQLYSVQRVSKEFRQAVLGCPLIRDKMFLNRSTNARETWKIVRGGHAGTHFENVEHWLFLQKPHEPAGPMFQAIAPSDPPPLQTFTLAVLHPVFLNGPRDRGVRREALRSAPVPWLNGVQRWVPTVMLPATFGLNTVGARSISLDAFVSDPSYIEIDVRVSHEMKSSILYSTKTLRTQSPDELKIKNVYDAVNRLSRALHRKAGHEKKQTLIKRELKISMPCGIHPVTTQEREEVGFLRAGL
jgi:hypothetical protein